MYLCFSSDGQDSGDAFLITPRSSYKNLRCRGRLIAGGLCAAIDGSLWRSGADEWTAVQNFRFQVNAAQTRYGWLKQQVASGRDVQATWREAKALLTLVCMLALAVFGRISVGDLTFSLCRPELTLMSQQTCSGESAGSHRLPSVLVIAGGEHPTGGW